MSRKDGLWHVRGKRACGMSGEMGLWYAMKSTLVASMSVERGLVAYQGKSVGGMSGKVGLWHVRGHGAYIMYREIIFNMSGATYL